MTTIASIMSTSPTTVAPSDSLAAAATLMRTADVGALPVCDGGRLVGIVTDRDIAVRCVAEGKADSATVADAMSKSAKTCRAEDDVKQVMKLMGDAQLRRLPVVDANGALIGIVSLADIALRQHVDLDKTVRDISEPGGATSQAVNG